MTSLGLVGIADKGTYSAEATYNKGQFVLHDGSTWLALKDNLNGVTPAEGENWKYLARGFAAELLSLVTAIDSQGLSGSQGGRVNAQSLIDVLADKVANQLIAKSMMSNVQVNDAEKVPTSALAYAMQQSIETLNSKLSSYSKYITKFIHNEWINLDMNSSQNVLLLVNSLNQNNSNKCALYMVCAANEAEFTGSIIRIGGSFDALIYNWNTGLSIGINANEQQWLKVSFLYL